MRQYDLDGFEDFFSAFLFWRFLIQSSLWPITLRWDGPIDVKTAMSDANVEESLLYKYCAQYVSHSLPEWLHIMLLSLLLYSSHSPALSAAFLSLWEFIFLLSLPLEVALPLEPSSKPKYKNLTLWLCFLRGVDNCWVKKATVSHHPP